jgi:inosine-uridine nucleoside N-ribohydrolase
MAQKIILDVDTGGDDAVAILLAGHHSSVDLVAVTVCHGNGPLEVTLDNTLRVLQAGQLEKTPVYAGSVHPIIGDLIQSHPIQKSILPLPPARITPTPGRAVDFIVDYYLGSNGPETIYAPTGPQTNLALALRLEPAIARRIPRIVTMAGAFTEGNTTPSAEFNILADPEAAHIVFNSGIPITMVGLEVTARAFITLADTDRLAEINTPQARVAAEIIRNEVNWFIDNLGLEGGQIFDASAVAAIIDPEIIQTRKMHVNIELHGTLTRGRTVADISGYHPVKQNVDVGIDIDRVHFLEILYKGLS